MGDLPLTSFLSKRIQLWHGLPIKKILLDYEKDYKKYKNNMLNRIYKWLYSLRIKLTYNELITSESILGHSLQHAMNIGNEKVKFYGTPSISYAYFLNHTEQQKRDGNHLKILYMPTWRDGSKMFSTVISGLISHNDFLKENHIYIDCKLHPMEARPDGIINTCKNLRFLGDVEDIISLYADYDALITDYSSACFEFIPFNKPYVFFVPDLKKYFLQRGSYLDTNDFYEGHPQNINELLTVIMKIKEGTWVNKNIYHYIGDNRNTLSRIYENYK